MPTKQIAQAISIDTWLTRSNPSGDLSRLNSISMEADMGRDNTESTKPRMSAAGQQAPPDVSEFRESKACKREKKWVPTAVIYCEGNFGKVDGKTANGLIRHSQSYNILSVIDSKLKGRDSGEMLDNVSNMIPIVENLEAAIRNEAQIPDTLIYGMAPSTGKMSPADREGVLDAIALGMNIVSGLHEYLGG